MKKYGRGVVGSMAGVLCLALGALANQPVGEDFLQNVQAAEIKNQATAAHDCYLAESVTLIHTAAGKLERRVESRQKLSNQGKAPVKIEFLEMSIDGKKLTQKEMEEEVAKSNDTLESQSPFSPEEMPKYEFESGGTTVCAGASVRVIAFHPKKPDEKLVAGKAYVREVDYHVNRLEFMPSKLPFAVKYIRGAMNFALSQDHWVPAEFEMEIHVKMALIITLAEKNISVKVRYRDFTSEANGPKLD